MERHPISIQPVNPVSFSRSQAGPRGLLDFGSIYPLPPIVVRQVYGPYVADLKAAIARLRSAGCEPRPQTRTRAPWVTAKRFLSGIHNNLWRFTNPNQQKYAMIIERKSVV